MDRTQLVNALKVATDLDHILIDEATTEALQWEAEFYGIIRRVA